MPKSTTPENNTSKSSREEYLADLLNHIEFEYRTLATKYNGLHSQDPENLNGRLDEMFAYVLGAKYAQAESLDLDKVLAKQAQAQEAILNYDNLRPVLSACLQTYLYKLYVHFLDIDKSTEREEDITVIQLFQTFDELFVRDLSRKVLAGNERSVANKIVRSHPKLYGYNYIKRKSLQENNRIEIVPKEAVVVQKIFRLYAGCFNPAEPFIGCDFDCNSCIIKKTSGIGIRRIINYLTACGIKTRNGKNFGSTTIKNILANEKYAGYINTGKYTTGTIFNKFSYSKVKDVYLRELDSENIEPIISPELFYLCATIRNSRLTLDSRGKPPARSAYGGGFLRCGKCGSNYLHNVDRGKGFYQCSLKKAKGLKACNSANISEATVDFYLTRYEQGELSLILLLYRQSVIIRALNAINYRLSFIRRNRDDAKLQTLQDEHKTLTKRLKNLYTRHADEEGDTTVLDDLIASTKAELELITAELDKYTKKPQQYLTEAENLATLTQTPFIRA